MYLAQSTPRRLAAALAAAATVAAALAAPAAAAPPATTPGASHARPPAGYLDKSELKAAGRQVVGSGLLPVTDGSAPTGTGTTYYVDSAGGDDDAAGTSRSSAWRTFANVNATVFGPGDRILLRAGSTWSAGGDEVAREAYDYTDWTTGEPRDVLGEPATALLAPRGSGTADAPVVLSSYGDGNAPELNGRGVVNDVLQLTGQQHWDISHLEISNVTDGFDPTTFEPAAGNGQTPGDENPATGDLRGIHVQAENAGTLKGFEIHDVFVRDVSGVTWSVSRAGLDRSKRTGGIVFEGLKGDALTASQLADVTVRDSYLANTSFANLSFRQFSGMGTNRYRDVAPGWGDRAAGAAAVDGTLTEDPDWRPHSDIEIADNYLTNRGTEYGWDAMYLTSVRGATVKGNVIDGAGVSGIEMYYSDDIVVQDNEVAELEPRTGAADSNGIDPDRGTSNILVQANYVHDSGEGILLCGFGFSTTVVRYNVIADVDRNYVNPHGNSGVNVVHNNLMYNTREPLKDSVGFFNSSGSNGSYLVERNRHHLIDNVFVNTREDVGGAAFAAGYPGVDFSHNAYFGPEVVAPAADAAAITGDPVLGGDPADDLRNIVPGSAASALISAGVAVDLAEIAPGIQVTGGTNRSALPPAGDFFGEQVLTPPHVGPASYRPATGNGLVTGLVTDQDGEPVAGATVSAGELTVAADDGGRYAIEVLAGDYALTPSADLYADGDTVEVTLGDGETLRRDLALGRTLTTQGTVAGTVSSGGEGLADASVTVSRGGQAVATATSGADGRFTVPGVDGGDGYTVSATKDGHLPASRSDVTVRAARTVTVDLVLSLDPGDVVHVIDEDFDDEPAGAFTGTADGVLAARADAGAGTVTVVDDPAGGGNRYLRLDKSGWGSLSVYNTSDLDLTGVVTLEARLQRTTTYDGPDQVAMYSYTESDWNAADPPSSSNPSATFGFSRGKIMTHNVTGSSSVVNAADYEVGRWYTVRNVVNLDTGTFDFYVDDLTTPVLADQPLRTQVDDLDRFLFFGNRSNEGDLLVDYFRVSTGTP
ncbi:carboxypeptidase regulatory-like domain-containing protein [Myceligenerans indicum]|uniref:Right handed beta helix domain-containing protein n=1 Tax=Myceligenerans indicum TaxID=2593663 RepID=A0ABS1LIG7_9MICO|nr:carboxypeptidase regulatory-like domain-containing protein [Myceligenerans indicum]MBL0885953.1 hypothetical protein [Myceligenerans indicum]